MNGTNRSLEEIARTIREAETIAVCSHVNPDGDTLGCAAAMRLALLSLGKKVSLFCDGKVPDHLMSFLPGADTIRVPGVGEGPFDLLLAVDVSDEKRLGACAALRSVSAHTAQVDHHPGNPLYMEENCVDGSAPAACVLIRELLRILIIVVAVDVYHGRGGEACEEGQVTGRKVAGGKNQVNSAERFPAMITPQPVGRFIRESQNPHNQLLTFCSS